MRIRPPLLLLALFTLVMMWPAAPARAVVCGGATPNVCINSGSLGTPAAGTREYVCSSSGNALNNKFEYYDGTSWLDVGFSGTGTGADCTNAAMAPGSTKYSTTAKNLEYCDAAGTPVCHQWACTNICTAVPWVFTTPQSKMLITDDATYNFASNQNFGWAVAANDKVAVVATPNVNWYYGSNMGFVYLYDISDPVAGPVWKKVVVGSGANNEFFGFSVAVSGNLMLVGAYGETSSQGSVFVYDITDPANPVLDAQINDPAATNNDQFGYAVALDGDTAVIGAKGSVKVYVYDLTNPASPVLQNGGVALTAPAGSGFGTSVAVNGSRMVAGAYTTTVGGVTNAGQAYVYDLSNLASIGGPYTINAGADKATGDNFGAAVAVSGTTAIAGAPNKTVGGFTNAGKVYVFDVTTPSTPTQVSTIPDPGGANGDRFGNAAAMSGTQAVIGSYTLFFNQGVAYVYGLSTPATPVNLVTGFAPRLQAADGATNDYFGQSVAIYGNKVLVGAYNKTSPTSVAGAGAAYLFSDNCTTTGCVTNGTCSTGGQLQYIPTNPVTFQYVNGKYFEYCDGTNWKPVGTCVTPNLSFTNQTNIALSTANVASNIIQIPPYLNCDQTAGLTTSNGATYRVCADATCSAGPAWVAAGTTTAASINQYLQLRVNASATPSTATGGTLTMGGVSMTPWTVTTCNTATLTFSAMQYQALNTAINSSDILQVPSNACAQVVTIGAVTGGGSLGKFRICTDSTCTAGSPAFGTTGTASPGQYIQMQLTTPNTYSTTSSVTLSLNGTAQTAWTVQTQLTPKRVFISSSTWRGGGASGFNTAGTWVIGNADARCQTLADGAGIGTIATGHTYKAWIAGSTTDDPATRFTKTFSYINTRGAGNGGPQIIWNSWSDLISGVFAIAPTITLNRSEGGASVSATSAWSNVNTNGVAISNGPDQDKNCASAGPANPWTSGSAGQHGYRGNTGVVDGTWTYDTSGVDQCSNASNHLYCFEQ